jgi:oligopeptide transport system substrate-binding protein
MLLYGGVSALQERARSGGWLSRATLLAVIVVLAFAPVRSVGQLPAAAGRELVVAYPRGEYSLDPLHSFTTIEAQLFTAVYEGLVAYDPITLSPVAGQAERWEISRDRRRYTFYLRENAKFSNGDALRAEDFRASWLRILEPGAAAEYSFLFDVISGVPEYRTGQVASTERIGIRAVGERVLEVELAEPAAHFLKTLAHHSFSAIHSSYIGAVNWDRTGQLIGNGPFYVVEWTAERLLLARNPHYWGDHQVQLDRVRILFSNDFQDVVNRFMAGDVHWANVPLAGDDCRLPFVICNPLFATSYFFFHTGQEPFDDERVRRGLALLLPWNQIRDPQALFPSQPAHSLVPSITDYAGQHDALDCSLDLEPPSTPQSEPSTPPSTEPSTEADGTVAAADCNGDNIRQGLRLLNQAGFARGRNLPPITIKIRAGSAAIRVAEVMKQTWEEQILAEVTIQEFDSAEFVSEVQAGAFTLSHQTWVGDFADPVTFLQMWTRLSNLNDARYSNRRYERALADADRSDGPARTAALMRAEKILLDAAVILPVSRHVALNMLHNGRVSGWYTNALDIHPFRFLNFRRVTGPPGVAVAPATALPGYTGGGVGSSAPVP